ncbi:hypothetical protein GCM10022254_18650 [Actinomadura meridiana]|uniref:Major facilitator superfamily (MFS) profile domain-containing protein n=1 Tax=Actinomadura meridiana TaxID=559626 RepID=A0ABP8BWE1_9ACTN
MSVETEPSRATVTGRLPLGVYLLAFSLFAMGSAEFLLAGVLPAIADDLDISLSAAGALISAFAVGVVVGGPPLAILTLRWPRRTTLITTQAIFAAALAVGLVTDDYATLLVTRFVCGLAYAGYWAVAAVTAISLVAPDRAARASGVVVSGLSLAMIAGGPAGALLSYFTGWRGGFWGVAALTAVGAVLTLVAVPTTGGDRRPSVRRELTTMRRPQLWAVYAATILSTAAYMISFNGATTVSAFQLGISLVPALAGTALNAGASITAVCWIGAALAVAMIPTVLADRAIGHRCRA